MEGGSETQDHGQAIYAKIRYSVSSTFATGCSMETRLKMKSALNERVLVHFDTLKAFNAVT